MIRLRVRDDKDKLRIAQAPRQSLRVSQPQPLKISQTIGPQNSRGLAMEQNRLFKSGQITPQQFKTRIGAIYSGDLVQPNSAKNTLQLRGFGEQATGALLNIGQFNPVSNIGRVGGFIDEATEGVPGLGGFGNVVGRTTAPLARFGDTRGTIADPSNFSSRIGSEAAMFAQNVGQFANFGVTPNLATAGIFGGVGADTIKNLRSQGASQGEAVLKGSLNALIQAATERISNKFQLNGPNIGKLNQFLAGAATEGGEEAVQQITDNLFNNRNWHDGVAENAVRGAVYGGLLQGGIRLAGRPEGPTSELVKNEAGRVANRALTVDDIELQELYKTRGEQLVRLGQAQDAGRKQQAGQLEKSIKLLDKEIQDRIRRGGPKIGLSTLRVDDDGNPIRPGGETGSIRIQGTDPTATPAGGGLRLPGSQESTVSQNQDNPRDSLRQEARKYKTVHQDGKSIEVDGDPVQIADGIDTFIHQDENGNWAVSEATSGRSLTGGGYENKTLAIKAAKQLLDERGVDAVKKRIAEVTATQPTKGATEPQVIPTFEESLDQQGRETLQPQRSKGFILRETGSGNQRIRVRRGPEGLESTLEQALPGQSLRVSPGQRDSIALNRGPNNQTDASPSPEIQQNQGGSGQPPIPVNPKSFDDIEPDAPKIVKDLKNKQDKQLFMELTERYIGQERAGSVNADMQARAYNDAHGKLTDKQKVEAILAKDGVQESSDPAVGNAIKTLDRIFDDAYRYFTQEKGINMGYQADYLPRIYGGPDGELLNAQEFKLLQTGSKRQKGRTADEVNVDKLVSKDPTDLIQRYFSSLERAAAGKQYLNELEQEGLVVRATDGSQVRGLRPVLAEGLQPGDGTLYYARKDVATKLNNLFGDKEAIGAFEKTVEKLADLNNFVQTLVLSGGVPNTPINAFGIMQGVKESLALHPIRWGKSMYVGSNRKFADKFFTQKAPIARLAAEHGVDIRNHIRPAYQSFVNQIASAEGGKETTSTVFHGLVDEPTFGRMMPALTLMKFESTYNMLVKKNVPADEAAQIAADATKNWMGQTDLSRTETRSEVGKDAVTAVFFAPKFRESMVNFWAKNGKALKNPTAIENRDNLKFMIAAALLYAVMDAANEELNGVHMWENPDNKQDKLLIPNGPGGKTVGIPFLSSIATVPRNAIQLVGNLASGNLKGAGQNVGAFASIPLRTAFELGTNQDYFGNRIVQDDASTAEKFGQAGSYILKNNMQPYVREGLNAIGQQLPEDAQRFLGVRDQPGVQTATQALELPIRYYDPNYFEYGGVRLDEDQREQLRDLPTDQRKQFIDSVVGRKNELSQIGKAGDNYDPSSADLRGDLSARAETLRDEVSATRKSLEEVRNENNLPDGVDSYKKLAAHLSNNYEDFVEAYNLDPSEPDTGSGEFAGLIEQNTESERITTAKALFNGYEDVPEWVKERYYEEAGVTKEDIQFDIAAGFKVADKASFLADELSQLPPQQRALRLLERYMKPSVTGKYFASYGAIDDLADMGVISEDEAKELKRLKWDENTGKYVDKYSSSRGGRSGGGRSIKVSSLAPKGSVTTANDIRIAFDKVTPKSTRTSVPGDPSRIIRIARG